MKSLFTHSWSQCLTVLGVWCSQIFAFPSDCCSKVRCFNRVTSGRNAHFLITAHDIAGVGTEQFKVHSSKVRPIECKGSLQRRSIVETLDDPYRSSLPITALRTKLTTTAAARATVKAVGPKRSSKPPNPATPEPLAPPLVLIRFARQ